MNKEEYISYYDLLTMIKDMQGISNKKDYPEVYWHNNYREKVLYIPSFDNVNNELEGYHIKQRNLENEDVRYWLSECMLESSMFDKCLEIKEKTNKTKIQKEFSKIQSEVDLLSNEIGKYHNIIHSMRDRNNYMKDKLKQLQSEMVNSNELRKENKQLKDNWNKLKVYAQEKYNNPSWASCGARYILEKIQELEKVEE